MTTNERFPLYWPVQSENTVCYSLPQEMLTIRHLGANRDLEFCRLPTRSHLVLGEHAEQIVGAFKQVLHLQIVISFNLQFQSVFAYPSEAVSVTRPSSMQTRTTYLAQYVPTERCSHKALHLERGLSRLHRARLEPHGSQGVALLDDVARNRGTSVLLGSVPADGDEVRPHLLHSQVLRALRLIWDKNVPCPPKHETHLSVPFLCTQEGVRHKRCSARTHTHTHTHRHTQTHTDTDTDRQTDTHTHTHTHTMKPQPLTEGQFGLDGFEHLARLARADLVLGDHAEVVVVALKQTRRLEPATAQKGQNGV